MRYVVRDYEISQLLIRYIVWPFTADEHAPVPRFSYHGGSEWLKVLSEV